MRNDPVVIKGSREGIFLYLDPETEFKSIMKTLSAKLSASKEFLAGAQVICNFGSRDITAENIAELEGIFKLHQVQLKRVSNSSPSRPTSRGDTVPARDTGHFHPYADEQTVLIKRTLRSGQSISYDGNVVVLGDVNPGAEVVASGNVIVMGALRGVVHAGATGNASSVVTAIRLKPTQLRIADQITRAPDDDNEEPDVPEIARIKDGVVTIERYVPNERQARAR